MKKFMLVLMAVLAFYGCQDEPEPTESTTEAPRGGKGDTTAACDADEFVLTCIADQCPGLTDAEFDDCFETNCEADADDTPLDCGQCVVFGFEDGLDAAGIVATCTGGEVDTTSCSTDEPVLGCINAECAGLVDADFDSCFEANCEADATDTPIECALCIRDGFEASLDAEGITTACTNAEGSTPTTLTGVACGADEALFTCMSDSCPDASTPDAAGECIADSCSVEAEETNVACLVCVDGHLAAGEDGSAEEACTAAGSSPCTVEVATALRECADVECSGRQGDALDECMDTSCPEVFDDITEACGNCVIGLNSRGVPFSDAAGHCAGG